MQKRHILLYAIARRPRGWEFPNDVIRFWRFYLGCWTITWYSMSHVLRDGD